MAQAEVGNEDNRATTVPKLESNKQEKSKDSNNHSNNDGKSDPNTKNESLFVKLVRSIKIADLEAEIKEDGGPTSILGKFKDYENDLIAMTQDGTKKDDIVSFIMNPQRIGLTDKDDATLFVTRLLKAHPKQAQSNGM